MAAEVEARVMSGGRGDKSSKNGDPVQTWHSWVVSEAKTSEQSLRDNSNFCFLLLNGGDRGSCSGYDISCVTIGMQSFRHQVPHI